MQIDLTPQESARLSAGSVTLWRHIPDDDVIDTRFGQHILTPLPRPGDVVECWKEIRIHNSIAKRTIVGLTRQFLTVAAIHPCRVRDVTEQEAQAIGYTAGDVVVGVESVRLKADGMFRIEHGIEHGLDAWGMVLTLENRA